MKFTPLALTRGKRLSIILLVNLFSFSYVFSQTVVESKAKVENVNFSYLMDQVVIAYDLSDAGLREKFTITLRVFTTDGEWSNDWVNPANNRYSKV